jgi:hypothetical protein
MEKEKGQPKTYLVTSELLMDLMRYLMTRPYGEVHTVMNKLASLVPYTGESNDGKK